MLPKQGIGRPGARGSKLSTGPERDRWQRADALEADAGVLDARADRSSGSVRRTMAADAEVPSSALIWKRTGRQWRFGREPASGPSRRIARGRQAGERWSSEDGCALEHAGFGPGPEKRGAGARSGPWPGVSVVMRRGARARPAGSAGRD